MLAISVRGLDQIFTYETADKLCAAFFLFAKFSIHPGNVGEWGKNSCKKTVGKVESRSR